MIEDSKRIIPNPPIKDENISTIEQINVPKFKEKKDNANTSPTKIKTDIIFPTEYKFDKTHMPSLELIKNNEENRNLNIPVYIAFNAIFNKKDYDNILKKLKIKEDCLLTQKTYGDGNCHFRCISYFLTGTEAYHGFMRNLLYNYIINHLEEIIIEFPYIYYNGNAVNTDEYIPLIQENGNFGGELECNLFTKVIPISVLVLTYDENKDGNNYFNYYMYYGFKNVDNYIPLCILDYKESKKHYQLLYYNKHFEDEIFFPENEESNNISNNTNDEKQKPNLNHLKKEEKFNNQYQIVQNNTDNNSEDKNQILDNKENIKKMN